MTSSFPRVLLVGDYPPPHGGVAVHVSQLHRALAERGLPVRVLDIGKGEGANPAAATGRVGRQDPDIVPVRTAQGLAAALWSEGRDAVVHLHTSGNNPKAFLVAAAVGAPGLLGHGPRVVTLHSGLLPAFLRASLSHRLLARAALRPYTRIVAVSQAIQEALLESLGLPSERILVHPAFCASQVRPGAAPAALEGALSRRRPLLVMAHHPSPVYGRTLLFEALAQLARTLPGVGLALFGPGTSSAQVRADAERFGIADRLEDFGELAHQQALALIQRAHVFVRPTTADGDSIPVREALALGVPCVASDVTMRPPGTRLFRAGDPGSLAEAVTAAIAQGPSRCRQPDAVPVLETLYRQVLGDQTVHTLAASSARTAIDTSGGK